MMVTLVRKSFTLWNPGGENKIVPNKVQNVVVDQYSRQYHNFLQRRKLSEVAGCQVFIQSKPEKNDFIYCRYLES